MGDEEKRVKKPNYPCFGEITFSGFCGISDCYYEKDMGYCDKECDWEECPDGGLSDRYDEYKELTVCPFCWNYFEKD